jgi:chromosome segregation ATPase
VVAKDFD